jgi:uncharacterized heparinase superfamily protein
MRRAQLYFHTLRYLHARQVPARARLRVARALREWAPGLTSHWRRRAAARIAWPAAPAALSTPRPLGLTEADEIRALVAAWQQGTPAYLNTSVAVGWPPRWAASGASQLWRYHLHYFDEAPLLAQGDEEAHDVLRTLVSHWIGEVPSGSRAHRDAWHPYVVSLRLANWLLAWLYAPDLFGGDQRFADSVREHAVFLSANLETDVGGNHLLKNLKALALAGACWPAWHPDRATLAPFAIAFAEQTLVDGVHYERSPMYHCQVLGDALEVLLVLRATGQTPPESFLADVARMVGALRVLTHPDRDIALLSDSAFGMSFAPSALHAAWSDLLGTPAGEASALRHRPLLGHERPLLTRPRTEAADLPDGPIVVHATRHADTHSGIVALDTARVRVIADVGALCPDELPAHAHADTFTFELSLDGIRFVVDAGVDEYAPGPWRAYYRSTRAHNTVAIDGEDSSECWGSFRAARRAHVRHARLTTRDGWQTLTAQHDGYRRLPMPAMHGRTFSLHECGVLVVRDDVAGSGTHRVERFLHLHPDTEIVAGLGPRDLVLRRGAAAMRLAWTDADPPTTVTGATSPPQGWYGDRFGARRPAPVLVWSAEGPLPHRSAFALAPLEIAPLSVPFVVTTTGAISSPLLDLPPAPLDTSEGS